MVPTVLSPAITSAPTGGAASSKLTGNDAIARGAAMLDPRNHFLPDEAAFPEIDAVQLVEIGVMREGVAVEKIHAALRHAERDAMRVVVVGVGACRAKVGGCVFRCVRRNQNPRAQARAAAGSAKDDALGGAAVAVPDREHRKIGLLDRHFGTQPVEGRASATARPQCSDRAIDDRMRPRRRRRHHEKIGDDLALRA